MYKLIILISIFFFNALQAQNKWKKITILTATGDSLKGEIEIRTRFKSFKSLAIRNKETKLITVYKPKDIKSFMIKDEEQNLYFKKLELEADYSSTDLSFLSHSPIVTLERDTVFAQLLEDGTEKLYSYKDNKAYKVHYVIETPGGQVIDLINKHYFVNNEKTLSVCSEEYKKQLNQLLQGSMDKINATSFTQSGIKKLIKEYNNCITDKKNTYEYKEEKMKVCFSIIAGGHSASLKFRGANTELNQLELSPFQGFNGGVALNVILPKTHKHWSLYNEVLYSSYKFQSKDFYSYTMTTADVSVNAEYLKLFNSLRYQHAFGHFTPFIQLGIVNGIAVTYDATEHYHNTGAISATSPILAFRRYEQSIFWGIGTHYRNIGLELRYEMGNGMSMDEEIASVTRSMYVLLNYSFK